MKANIFWTVLVWIVCAFGEDAFPECGFQFASGMVTGLIWAEWFQASDKKDVG